MNVVRIENSLAPTRGRRRGRGNGRTGTLVPNNNQTVNVLPKYQFKGEFRRPLVNLIPTSSSATRTPRNTRRGTTSSSSAFPKSSSRHRGIESGASAQISPGSITSTSDHCVIIAITSGRGEARGEVGMAAIDVQYPHMILCQISDCNAYINTLTKIHALQPVEIIMPDTMCERGNYPSGLYRAIKQKFESVNITAIARMHFHDSAGMDRIKTHCADEFAGVELFVKQKYYALAAASALLKYVEFIQHIVYAPKSMKIDFEGSANTAMIDIESAQNLELVMSQGGDVKFCLLGSLDRCSTPMGRRLLRASILQPPCEKNVVEGRLACVAELLSNRSLHLIIQPVVKRLCGVNRLLSLSILTSQADCIEAAEKNLNYILLLKNVIDIIPDLRSVMSTGIAAFFQKVFQDLKDQRYQQIMDKILSLVHPDARAVMGYTSSNMQRCFAIRSGISDMLDIARQTYCELIDDMQSMVEKLAERHNLPLSLGCNASFGYHIQMEVPRRQNFNLTDLPEEFIEAHKQKNTIFMTTEILLVLSRHCKDACEELHLMSNALLNEILISVREHIGCLFQLSDDVAELDLVISLSEVSSIPDYVKPVFSTRLELRDSRHPVMDISGTDSPIPNDVTASVTKNFHTITGPNMSGKSVYLKQIVLLQIMAQIGCYVPASKAEFRIADRIFCRICSRDDMECNASTFVLEMKEAQYILQSITSNTLVIIDELCRSTTVEEGTSIAWAICETLLQTTAFIFNATHFLYLTRLAELYYNVTNHHFETVSKVSETSNCDTRLIYTHKLKNGNACVENYGIALARSTGLPMNIVSIAQNLATEIAKTIKPADIRNQINSWQKDSYDCVAEMYKLIESDEFTVGNIVKIVNDFNVSGIMRKMRNLNPNEKLERNNEIKALSYDSPSKINEQAVEVRQLSKRVYATTSISVNMEIKKPRQTISEDSRRPIKFNYLREAMKGARSQEYLAKSGQIAEKSVTEAQNNPSERLDLPCNNTATTVEMMDLTSEIYSNPSYHRCLEEEIPQSLKHPRLSQLPCSERIESNHSEISIPTLAAEKTARQKEAEIFKIIEGNDFNEASFYESFNSTISLDSIDDDNN